MLSPKKIYQIYRHGFAVGFRNKSMNHNELDALGNKLIVGERYGYSQSNNGISRVVVGEYIKPNKNSVTLSIVYSHGGYDYKQEDYQSFTRKVSVRSIILFPCFGYQTAEEIQQEKNEQEELAKRNKGSQYEYFGQFP